MAKKRTKKRTRGKSAKRSRQKVKRMPAKELKIYRQILLKEREKIGGGLTHHTDEALKQSQRDAAGDLSGYSYHMADMASDNYEREFSLGRATEEQKLLYAIDEAMKRIADGTYGICQECGNIISKKRLKALPHTELCIKCQEEAEKG